MGPLAALTLHTRPLRSQVFLLHPGLQRGAEGRRGAQGRTEDASDSWAQGLGGILPIVAMGQVDRWAGGALQSGTQGSSPFSANREVSKLLGASVSSSEKETEAPCPLELPLTSRASFGGGPALSAVFLFGKRSISAEGRLVSCACVILGPQLPSRKTGLVVAPALDGRLRERGKAGSTQQVPFRLGVPLPSSRPPCWPVLGWEVKGHLLLRWPGGRRAQGSCYCSAVHSLVLGIELTSAAQITVCLNRSGGRGRAGRHHTPSQASSQILTPRPALSGLSLPICARVSARPL